MVSHHPNLILTVTGIDMAFETFLTINCASSGSFNRALPPPFLAIFFTGQPILISIRNAPDDSALMAASTIEFGLWSKS